MPIFRRFGNNILTILNKVSTGYWDVSDPQNGYTAIKISALKKLNFSNVFDRYGYCNDLLIEANINNLKVTDVSMPPVYEDERSDIKIGRYVISLSYLLTKGFFRRLHSKYGGQIFILFCCTLFGFIIWFYYSIAIW